MTMYRNDAPSPLDSDINDEDTGEEVEEEPRPRPAFDVTGSIRRAVSNPTDGITDYSERDAKDDLEYDSDDPDSEDGLDRTDVDDILDVDMADVTGYPEDRGEPKKRRFSRTSKKFRPSSQPPTAMGGMQV